MQLKSWCALALVVSFAAVPARAEDAKKEAPKKEDKKVEIKAETKDEKKDKEALTVSYPEAVSKAWAERYKEVSDVTVKEHSDSFVFTGRDQWNEKVKVVYGRDGKLWEESDRKLPLAKVPAVVVEAAKKWAPAATWSDTAEVETDKGELPLYELEGTLNGKKIEAEIREDGTVKKASKLEEAKADKKEETKVEIKK